MKLTTEESIVIELPNGTVLEVAMVERDGEYTIYTDHRDALGEDSNDGLCIDIEIPEVDEDQEIMNQIYALMDNDDPDVHTAVGILAKTVDYTETELLAIYDNQGQ